MKSIVALILSIFICSCYTNIVNSQNSNKDINQILSDDYFIPTDDNNKKITNLLCQEWKRSTEEERDSVQIYRPSILYDFPPSRFRETFKFLKDGKFKYLYLSPNDAHYYKYGNWGINKKDTNIIGLKYSSEKIEQIKVIRINENSFSFILLDSKVLKY